MKKIVLNLCCIIVICYLFLCMSGCKSPDEESEQAKISDLNNFSAFALDNELYTQEIFADYDVTLILFWAPWSDISVYELGQLETLMMEAPDNILFLTVCFDGTEKNVNDALKTAGAEKVTTLLSGDGQFKTVSDEIRDIPTVIIVDNKGNVIGDPIVGVKDNIKEYYIKEINKSLKKIHKPIIEIPEEDTAKKL